MQFIATYATGTCSLLFKVSFKIETFNFGFLPDEIYIYGVRGGAVGWGTALQAGRSRSSIPDGVTEIFH